MVCKDCGNRGKPTVFDRRGNRIVNEVVNREEELVNDLLSFGGNKLSEMTTEQILKDKKEYRDKYKDKQDKFISKLPEAVKKVILIELISVYNCEDIYLSRVSPSQALVSLWKYVHNPYFQTILREFPGLVEEVDNKYNKLVENRIKNNWLHNK